MARKIWTGPDERGRLAKSLIVLYDQVRAAAPNAETSSDGSIGDAAHASRASDHNPGGANGRTPGIVRAIDITHDPRDGLDTYALAEHLRKSKNPKILNVISNGRIFSSETSPWQWRTYNGSNPHNHHVHIAVVDDKALYDNEAAWSIGAMQADPSAPKAWPRIHRGDTGEYVRILQQALGIEVDGIFGEQTEKAVIAFQNRMGLEPDGWVGPYTWDALPIQTAPKGAVHKDIIATEFGGADDPNFSAYDEHFITDQELGVALPFRFAKPLPLVWVEGPDGRVDNVPIVDVGPIYPHASRGPADPYWETGARPRAETNQVMSQAGIDLTPALARAVGIDDKGKVDWGFMEKPMADDIKALTKAVEDLAKVVDAIMIKIGMKPATPPPTQTTPPPVIPDEVVPALEKPGVATSIFAGIIGFVAQLLGFVGTPAVVGTNPSDVGTAVTVLPALSTLFGMAGGWRGIINFATKLLGR